MRWLQTQCRGSFWKHIQETLAVATSVVNFGRWGIESAFDRSVLDEQGLDAHIASQGQLAAFVGDMVLGVSFSRFVWGLDIMHGFPKRASLLSSDDRGSIAHEMKRCWDMVAAMKASNSAACRVKAERSHMLHTSTLQFIYLLRNNGWAPCEQATRCAERRFSRVMSTSRRGGSAPRAKYFRAPQPHSSCVPSCCPPLLARKQINPGPQIRSGSGGLQRRESG